MNKLKIIIISTSPLVVNSFMNGQIVRFAEKNHVTVVTNTEGLPKLDFSSSKVEVKNINISRKISILRDISSFIRILLILAEGDFDLVYTITPKAGLLGMVGGLVMRVKCRIHIFTGQVWATKTGINRKFLKLMDMLIAKSSTHLLTDSVGQMNNLINEKITSISKIKVLANGSVNGVDFSRFRKDVVVREKYRVKYNVASDDVVFLYLGRLNKEKGLVELVEAFVMLLEKFKNVKLIIVGPDEQNMSQSISANLVAYKDHYEVESFTDHPGNFMNMADVICVPSYREGFGSVVIEAAGVGVPAIGSKIYGLEDAIQGNVTGLLFPAKDSKSLCEAMQKMVSKPDLRKKLGISAQERAESLFSQGLVTSAYVSYCEQTAQSYI